MRKEKWREKRASAMIPLLSANTRRSGSKNNRQRIETTQRKNNFIRWVVSTSISHQTWLQRKKNRNEIEKS
jgi:hypothetical protein